MHDAFGGHEPEVAETAFVSKMAYLVGEVSIGAESSVWPFVCLRGDGGETTVGEGSNVQEFSMLHGAAVGDRVTVGHNVVIDYATIESDSLVGIQSVVLGGATVESNALVAAGSVVLQDQTVPEGHLAYGAPAETRPLSEDQRAEIDRIQDHYVDLAAEYRSAGEL